MASASALGAMRPTAVRATVMVMMVLCSRHAEAKPLL